MITFNKSLKFKEMIIQLVVYLILLFQRTLQDDSNRLGKQQELDAHPKSMQQINFAGNLD